MRTEKEIMEAVQKHHEYMEQAMSDRATVLMTVLVGSQNYGIAHENSDIDTCSFVLPSIMQIATGKDYISTEYEFEDGKCMVKDIRTALNLLQKTSPNSVEWFCSNYNVYNTNFEKILKRYLQDRKNFLYCDIHNMGNACKGMSYQLKNRNMPIGKKYAHALRVLDMWLNYMDENTDDILHFKDEETRKLALAAKTGTIGLSNEEMQSRIEQIAEQIGKLTELYNDVNTASISKKQKKYVSYFQYTLFSKHIMLELAKVYDV